MTCNVRMLCVELTWCDVECGDVTTCVWDVDVMMGRRGGERETCHGVHRRGEMREEHRKLEGGNTIEMELLQSMCVSMSSYAITCTYDAYQHD